MNILLYTEVDLSSIVGIEADFIYCFIPEMVDNCYSLDITAAEWDKLDLYLVANDNKLEVIGGWDQKDGKAKEDAKEKDKFKKTKYEKYLRDIAIEWDAEGIATKWEKAPTDTKVNKFAGWIERDITTDVL